MTTEIGICNASDLYSLEQVATKFQGIYIRFGLDFEGVSYKIENSDAKVVVNRVREFGFKPLPILGGTPGKDVLRTDNEINRFAAWCGQTTADNDLGRVILLNEPATMAKWKATTSDNRYRWVAEACCRAILAARPGTEIYLAGEMLKPDKKGCDKRGFYRSATEGIPLGLYVGCDIHPYRNPSDPFTAQIGGNCWGRGATRDKEYDYCHTQARGKKLIVGEVGWNYREGVSEDRVARYYIEELKLAERNGVEILCFYAHVGSTTKGDTDWGMWEDTGDNWRPRPAVAAVREWLDGRTT